MISQLSQQTIVIGGTTDAEGLRRKLAAESLDPVTVAGHLRGLRRSLVLGEMQLAVVCVSLTPATMESFGEALQQLMNDQGGFSTAIRTIGMMDGRPMSEQARALECHMYTRGIQEAYEAVLLFREQVRSVWSVVRGTGRGQDGRVRDGKAPALQVAEARAEHARLSAMLRRRQGGSQEEND